MRSRSKESAMWASVASRSGGLSSRRGTTSRTSRRGAGRLFDRRLNDAGAWIEESAVNAQLELEHRRRGGEKSDPSSAQNVFADVDRRLERSGEHGDPPVVMEQHDRHEVSA